MSSIRQYKDEEVLVQVKGLDAGLKVRVHVEHKSGAALIVPDCQAQKDDRGYDLSMVGFDGTDFRITLDEPGQTIRIVASAVTPILGDKTELVLPRIADLGPHDSGELRITGDEVTRPIDVKR